MTFKELLKDDLKNTFININEFAEIINFCGIEIPGIISNDKLNEMTEKYSLDNEIYTSDMIVYFSKDALGMIPTTKDSVMINKENYFVLKVDEDESLVALHLKRVES